MKTHYIIILFFLLINLHLNAQVNFFIDSKSFTGTYYYPHERDNKFSYFDRHDIGFGIRYYDTRFVNVILRQRVRDNIFYTGVELDSLLISCTFTDYPGYITFLYGNIGYSLRSEPYIDNFVISGRDSFLFGDYRFTGLIKTANISERSILKALIGGSKYHNGIYSLSYSIEKERSDLILYYLYTDKDEILYSTTHLIGKDIGYVSNLWSIRNAFTVYYYPEAKLEIVWTNYSEFALYFDHLFEVGSSFLYKSKERGLNNNKEFTGYFRYDGRKWQITTFYDNINREHFSSQSISPVILYRIKENFLVGIESVLYNPKNSEYYYYSGITVRFDDLFNL